MMSTENPFDDEPQGTDDTPILSGAAEFIRRLAEIEDELGRRGANKLLTEQKKLKDALKKDMLAQGSSEAFDEISGYEAVLIPRRSDVYDMTRLQEILTDAQRERYIRLAVDIDALKGGIDSGDVSRAALERAGAVSKVSGGSPALYVRERKAEETV